MNVFTRSMLVLPLAFGAPAAMKALDVQPLTRAECAALRGPTAQLETLRAGAMTTSGLRTDERATLRQVQERSGELASLRGGMTDHDWIIVLVVVAVVLLIIVL